MNTTTEKRQLNRQLHSFTLNEYFSSIPLDTLFMIVETKTKSKIVQEDGTPWSGILCGDNSMARFAIAGRKYGLFIQWYKMESGRYEITAYVS